MIDLNKKGDAKGYLIGCLIQARGSEIIFNGREDGTIIPQLYEYAVIPMEVYKKLKKQS